MSDVVPTLASTPGSIVRVNVTGGSVPSTAVETTRCRRVTSETVPRTTPVASGVKGTSRGVAASRGTPESGAPAPEG